MSVRLSRLKDRIILSAPWSPSMARDCKSIPGASWSKVRKVWSYPLTMASLRALRREFGDDLAPDAEILAWAGAAAKRERTLKRLARRDDAKLLRLPLLAPRLAAAMATRTYQRSGARFGAVAGSCCFADEPGLGKTATSLAALIEADSWSGTHLIIAPKAALETVWKRQIEMWTDNAIAVAMPEGKAKREKALEAFWKIGDTSGPRFLIVNLAMVRRSYGHYCKKCEIWREDVEKKKIKAPVKHHMEDHTYARKIMSEDWPEILNHQWDSVILDESHEALAAYTPANKTQTVCGLLDLKAKHKFALTGTPLRGEEKRIWGTLDWLGVKTGGYWDWVEEYFEVASNGFAKIVHGLDPARAKDFYRLLDGYVLRRTRAEVRSDLPLGNRLDVMVDMSPKQRQQYEEFELMGETALESGLVSGMGTLSELTRLKQMAFGTWSDPDRTGHLIPTTDSPKLEWLLQFLKERGVSGRKAEQWFPENGSGYKYVVASQLSEVVDMLANTLNKAGIPTLKITGGVTGARRTDAINKFQSDDKEFRVMLINSKAGGASIELDAWCDEMVIMDETFIADDQVQLEGRINNRSGRVAPRIWWYVRTADTIDQSIAEGNLEQHDLQHNLLDGRRGVSTALHLIRSRKEVKDGTANRPAPRSVRPRVDLLRPPVAAQKKLRPKVRALARSSGRG